MIETQSYILFYVNGKRILGMLLNSLFSLKEYPMVVRINYSKNEKDKNVDPEETLLYYLRPVFKLML